MVINVDNKYGDFHVDMYVLINDGRLIGGCWGIIRQLSAYVAWLGFAVPMKNSRRSWEMPNFCQMR